MSEFNKEVFLQNLKEVNTVLKQIHICIDNIVKLSNDMAGADSEINEAILQLQQNVITINGTLTTYGQDITAINNALANKMYKVIEVDDTATSGTFTEEEYNLILNDNSIAIKRGSGYFIRDFEETYQTNMIRFRHFNTLSVSSNVITAKSQHITVNMNTNAWGYTSENDIKFYNQNYIDTYIQYKLTSGTNIKTINDESILGSGNISISGNKYYLHTMPMSCANSKSFTFTYISTDATPITYTDPNTIYNIFLKQFFKNGDVYSPRQTCFGINFNTEVIQTVGYYPRNVGFISISSNKFNVSFNIINSSLGITTMNFIVNDFTDYVTEL